jgi:hypothetical protein
MEFADLEYLTICEQCGCVFDFTWAQSDEDPKICYCPACKKRILNKRK